MWGCHTPYFLRKPSVILCLSVTWCLVGKSLHNDNSVSVFRGSLKLKLSFRIDIVVGLFCFKKDFDGLTLPLNLYVMIDYLQSIPSANFSCHTPPHSKALRHVTGWGVTPSHPQDAMSLELSQPEARQEMLCPHTGMQQQPSNRDNTCCWKIIINTKKHFASCIRKQ